MYILKLCIFYHNKRKKKRNETRALQCGIKEYSLESKNTKKKEKKYNITLQNYTRGHLKHYLLKEMSLFQIWSSPGPGRHVILVGWRNKWTVYFHDSPVMSQGGQCLRKWSAWPQSAEAGGNAPSYMVTFLQAVFLSPPRSTTCQDALVKSSCEDNGLHRAPTRRQVWCWVRVAAQYWAAKPALPSGTAQPDRPLLASKQPCSLVPKLIFTVVSHGSLVNIFSNLCEYSLKKNKNNFCFLSYKTNKLHPKIQQSHFWGVYPKELKVGIFAHKSSQQHCSQ